MTSEAVPGLEAATELLGSLGRVDEPIGPRTTYRVGGKASIFVELERDDDLARVCSAVRAGALPLLVMGNGSNMLIAEAGFAGICVMLGKSYEYVELAPDRVTAGASTPLPVLARRAAADGREALAWMVGVPGTVGGAVAMNAGGHGSDIASVLVSATVVDLSNGSVQVRGAESFEFAYRRARLSPTEVVLEATFAAPRRDPHRAAALIEEVVHWRREHQPGGRNAGSIFQNPAGDSAGRILDELGLKGMRVGGAAISEKHANFIQLDADGSSDDVESLIEQVIEIVAERSGLRLTSEVRRVGFGR